MGKRPQRYKLLLDENISPRDKYSILNNRHNVRHLVHDFKLSGIKDEKVYDLAVKEERLIVTYNRKDFEPLTLKSNKTGIICLSPHLILDDEIDIRVQALLTRKSRRQLFGHLNLIKTSKTEIR